jgi:magnesium-transporting ATPase (P-type)
MLTGDQGETAENIGYSCGLLDPVLSLIKMEGGSKEERIKGLKDILKNT